MWHAALFLSEDLFVSPQEKEQEEEADAASGGDEGLSPAAKAYEASMLSLDKASISLAAAAAAAAAAAGITHEELLLIQRAGLIYLLLWLYYTQPLPSNNSSSNNNSERDSSSSSSSSSSDLPSSPLPLPIRLSLGGSLCLSLYSLFAVSFLSPAFSFLRETESPLQLLLLLSMGCLGTP